MRRVGDDPLDVFEANRTRLLGLAYRLLGQATEAEDVVQDAFLRWRSSNSETDGNSPRSLALRPVRYAPSSGR